MKKLLIVIILFLLPSLVNAYDVEKRFIYYNLISKTQEAEVTYGDSKYGGTIDIPETITHDGITYTVTSIGPEAFRNCYSLKSVTIPKTIKKIGYLSFFGCSSLTKVNITDLASWCEIDYNGYEGVPLHWAHHLYLNNEEITELVIPDNVQYIKQHSFYECEGLISVKIPKTVKDFFNAFENCKNLKDVEINCSRVGEGAFVGCTSITDLTISNNVTLIMDVAFQNCKGLTSITLGKNVNYIGNCAFALCPNLMNVYCLAEKVPNTHVHAFYNSLIDYATLHVPDGTVDAYKEQEPWSQFKTIVPLHGEIPETPKCGTPSIKYQNGKLSFTCETEDVEFVTDITDKDIMIHHESEINLSVTYIINVYATKAGYDDSDVASATLCWVDAEPKSEGIENSIAHISARPIMIQYMDGAIKVTGADDEQLVNVYTLDGTFLGKSLSKDGIANINTGLQQSNILLVKVGSKTVKLMCE